MNQYKTGDILQVTVTGIADYGIFVCTEEHYTGLIHISEISDSFVRNISDYAEVGEVIRVRVLDFDEDSRRLKLSIKNLDYRERKSGFHKIEETGTGFAELEKSLPKWIAEKELEIGKNSKNM